MKEMKRREFLKGGLGALVVGTQLPWLISACGSGGGSAGSVSGGGSSGGTVHVESLKFTVTDAVKEMVTHNSINDATCYFWIYKEDRFPADSPGPHIFTTEGDKVEIELTNALDEDHAFFIPGVGGADSGRVAPGETKTFSFTAPKGGTYLYYDNLNAPVNRVMGLHGALIVMPRSSVTDVHSSPYTDPTNSVRQLFNDFGVAEHWPGLAWGQGDEDTDTPAFRQYVWVCSEASPVLFAEVGNHPAGQDYPAAQFMQRYHHDPYANTFLTGVFNRKPHYFTISGQSGHFSHNNPYICPNNRVGEPVLIRILNGGLQTHSMHIHANHVFVTWRNGAVQGNPLWLDVHQLNPLDTMDYTTPYMRPPDVPNQRGIGRPDPPLPVANPGARLPAPWGAGQGETEAGATTWPPLQELSMFMPLDGTLADPLDPNSVNIGVQCSPMCFPMHSHSEPSQVAQGGNYNCGLISGMNFTGDRNTPGGVTTFANVPTLHGPGETGPPTVPNAGHGG